MDSLSVAIRRMPGPCRPNPAFRRSAPASFARTGAYWARGPLPSPTSSAEATWDARGLRLGLNPGSAGMSQGCIASNRARVERASTPQRRTAGYTAWYAAYSRGRGSAFAAGARGSAPQAPPPPQSSSSTSMGTSWTSSSARSHFSTRPPSFVRLARCSMLV